MSAGAEELNRVLNGQELARAAGVSASKVSLDIGAGKLTCERVGNTLRIPPEAAERYIAEQAAKHSVMTLTEGWPTSRELAEAAGVSPSKISLDLKAGTLTGERIGNTLRIPPDVADRYCAELAARRSVVSLHAAAQKHGYDPKTVNKAFQMGRIRCVEQRQHAGGVQTFVDELEFLHDLDHLPKCRVTSALTRATIVRGRTVYATGAILSMGAGRWQLMLRDLRPLRRGRYTLRLRYRAGGRWITATRPITIT